MLESTELNPQKNKAEISLENKIYSNLEKINSLKKDLKTRNENNSGLIDLDDELLLLRACFDVVITRDEKLCSLLKKVLKIKKVVDRKTKKSATLLSNKKKELLLAKTEDYVIALEIFSDTLDKEVKKINAKIKASQKMGKSVKSLNSPSNTTFPPSQN